MASGITIVQDLLPEHTESMWNNTSTEQPKRKEKMRCHVINVIVQSVHSWTWNKLQEKTEFEWTNGQTNPFVVPNWQMVEDAFCFSPLNNILYDILHTIGQNCTGPISLSLCSR